MADALTLVAVMLAIAVAGLGERWSIAGMRISMSAGRLLLLAALVLVVRHAAQRRPPAHARLAAGIRAGLGRRPALAAVLPIWIATRPAVLLVGLVATLTIGFPPATHLPRISTDELWNLPARWDALWYMSIAHEGYHWAGTTEVQQNLTFFPAFPVLMRAGSWLGGTHLPLDVRLGWAGTFISLAAFLGALVYLYRLFAPALGEEAARAGAMLLATYPFALFYSVPYTESVYLLSVAGAFYHLRHDEIVSASAWALLAGLARPNGFVLALPLAVAALAMPRSRSSRAARLAVIIMPIAGMLIYSAYGYARTGRPLVWIELQRGGWGRGSLGPGAMAASLFDALAQWAAVRSPTMRVGDALNGLAAACALLTVWPVWRRLGAEYAVFVAAGVLLPLANGGVQSIGRFTAVLFPAFMWLAAVLGPAGRTGTALAFAIAQGMAAVLFFTWRPPV